MADITSSWHYPYLRCRLPCCGLRKPTRAPHVECRGKNVASSSVCCLARLKARCESGPDRISKLSPSTFPDRATPSSSPLTLFQKSIHAGVRINKSPRIPHLFRRIRIRIPRGQSSWSYPRTDSPVDTPFTPIHFPLITFSLNLYFHPSSKFIKSIGLS